MRNGQRDVLLEAYSAIAPPVGASIDLVPIGLRIMGQIGGYEVIARLYHEYLKKGYIRDQNGKIVSKIPYLFKHLERGHGYGLHFFNWQQLLQILFDHIQRKDRILLSKGGVNVTAADGSTYSGSFIVGADGIYSKGSVALVVSGPEDRVYWFFFDRPPEVKYGRDILKYTKKDEAEFVKQNGSRPITDKVTFGHIFANRLSSTLTPLHEVVFKKWFFKRMIVLGDSAHKPNPLNGQGGNGAIESCAELFNAILRKRKNRGGALDNLNDEGIVDIFTETQSSRHDRAEWIVREGHKRQALDAFEDPITSTIVQRLIQRLLGNEFALNLMGRGMVGASTLEDLPVPDRLRAVPFNDELPAKPLPDASSITVRWAL